MIVLWSVSRTFVEYSDRDTSINVNRLAVDEARLVRGEEGTHGGNFLRCSETPRRLTVKKQFFRRGHASQAVCQICHATTQ